MKHFKFQVSGSTSGAIRNESAPTLGRLALCGLIRLYQWTVSPWLGGNCRFYPSCSHYALEAVAQHGCLRGGWMSFKRVCKCHPLSRGGVDLVPAPVPVRK